MKKTIRFILALAMLLALTACGAGTKTAAEPAAETTVESAAEPEAAPRPRSIVAPLAYRPAGRGAASAEAGAGPASPTTLMSSIQPLWNRRP